MLSTAHRVLDGTEYTELSKAGRRLKRWRHPIPVVDQRLYKASHVNHPCNIWIRQSAANYQWLFDLYFHLHQEYKHRYNKDHKSWVDLHDILEEWPDNIPITDNEIPLDFAMAMPDQYKSDDPVEAYRNYYIGEKSDILSYTKRKPPYWAGEAGKFVQPFA